MIFWLTNKDKFSTDLSERSIAAAINYSQVLL